MKKKTLFTATQMADYEKDGFVLLRGLFDETQARNLSLWTDELVARPLERDKMMVYFEKSSFDRDERIVARIERFTDYHDGFRSIINGEALLGRASELLGSPAILFKEKINFKMPGGHGFNPHQDMQSTWDEYTDMFVTALVAIDKSTPENGCIELAAGQHRRGLFGRRFEALTGSELEGVEFQKFPMEPGDVVFFSSFTPHQSAANFSKFSRRNLYLTYNIAEKGDHRAKYFADKCEVYPPDLEREPGKKYEYKL